MFLLCLKDIYFCFIQYPVVAIDNFMPIVDPFNGLHVGQLKVLLAMGSDLQVKSKDMPHETEICILKYIFMLLIIVEHCIPCYKKEH